MGRKYSNPPIEEALCEFHFIASQPWDMTQPGLFYEEIREEYPEKKQLLEYGIDFKGERGAIEQKVRMSPRIQFFSSDGKALVQLSADLLTINFLKPYPTWEIFKPKIFYNLEKYMKIAKPKKFDKIGLRYINKIKFSKMPIELSNYFNFYPLIPNNLPQEHGPFNLGIEIPYESGRDILNIKLISMMPDKKGDAPILLDIRYNLIKPEELSENEIQEWIENAHERIEYAFEECITDKCREMFKERE